MDLLQEPRSDGPPDPSDLAATEGWGVDSAIECSRANFREEESQRYAFWKCHVIRRV